MRITFTTLFLISLLLWPTFANAEIAAMFVASDDPEASMDGNSGTLDVWSYSGSSSAASVFNGGRGWGIRSGGLSASDSVEIVATISSDSPTIPSLINDSFELSGSTISIAFSHDATGSQANDAQVGIQFLKSGVVQTELTLDGPTPSNPVYNVSGAPTNVASSGRTDLQLQLSLTDNLGGYQLAIEDADDSMNTQVVPGVFANGAGIDQIRVFAIGTGSSPFGQVYVNNLEILAVPEPMTVSSFGLGLVFLLGRRQRA